jgi:SAM-dependent methyltransferase
VREIATRYLSDHKGFNHGQGATLLEMEAPGDYDALLGNILRTGYYDGAYFQKHSGYRQRAWLRDWPALRRFSVVSHFWSVAEMVLALGPRDALEVGCGRGDVLALLKARGIRVAGMDVGEDALDRVWPELKADVRTGDFTVLAADEAAQGRRFDTVLGFDIWEHLLPDRLQAGIAAVAQAASDAALFFFIIPGFGEDRVFGEQFPLEFEEARADFDARRPFKHLLAEKLNPPIPASGHLIWAHSEWWERQFVSAGMTREVALERKLHGVFDSLLPHSTQAFYVFSRGAGGAARAREALDRPTRPAVLAQVAALRRARALRTRLRDAVPKPLRVLRRRWTAP